MLRAQDILDQFDEAAASGRFPEPEHPYSYLMAARLHAYADGARWTLVVETVGYNPRAANVVTVLNALGNCLPAHSSDGTVQRHLLRVDNFQELFDGETWPVRYRQVPIVVRDRALRVNAEPDLPQEDVFRLLVPEHRDLLLADEAELRDIVPADLPEVLRLDDWHHAALRVHPRGPQTDRRRRQHDMLTRHQPPDEHVPFEVRPSDVETYRQVSQVLATANAAHYRPTLSPNTHWSNWPMSGAL